MKHKSKDLTNKYMYMIEAFECDFVFSVRGDFSLRCLQDKIENKENKLLKDINLLEELSFGLRHGYLRIYDIRGE